MHGYGLTSRIASWGFFWAFLSVSCMIPAAVAQDARPTELVMPAPFGDETYWKLTAQEIGAPLAAMIRRLAEHGFADEARTWCDSADRCMEEFAGWDVDSEGRFLNTYPVVLDYRWLAFKKGIVERVERKWIMLSVTCPDVRCWVEPGIRFFGLDGGIE